MEDTASKQIVVDLAKLLEEHKASDTVVIDISRQSSWTDYFVICTVTSQAHTRGLVRYIREFLKERDVEPYHRHKSTAEEGWTLIDCGRFVVHLMTNELRSFYELERLWFSGQTVYHSSKSS